MSNELKKFSFITPTRALIGINVVSIVGKKVRTLSNTNKRTLIVTDKNIIRAGISKKIRNPLYLRL